MTDNKQPESKHITVACAEYPAFTPEIYRSFSSDVQTKLGKIYDLVEQGNAELDRVIHGSLEAKEKQSVFDSQITNCENIESILSEITAVCTDDTQRACIAGISHDVNMSRAVLLVPNGDSVD